MQFISIVKWKYNNNRNRNLIHKKKLEADEPKKKLGRPPKPFEQIQKLRVGRPLKYPNESYVNSE